MKKICNILTLAALLTAITSCDPVDEENRFTVAADINTDRKVLVEEFTGQFCPNCPLGHKAIESIMAQYGEHAVIVSIHSGEMADNDPEYGLKTPEGDVYARQYSIDYYPSAVVNRIGTVLSDRSTWQGAVFRAARQQAQASIDLKARIEDGNIVIESHLTAKSGSCTANYQLWVTENGIHAWQLDGEDYLMDYVHNHVYRASINGVGGETVTLDSKETSLTHSIELSEKWNKDNLQIVAFLYDKGGVLQAEEIDIE